MAKVVLENLSKIYHGASGGRVGAVQGACLTVEENELLVLVGPSGCGKTTLLRLIAGLEEVSAGTITIDGQDVAGCPPHARDLAMVFQNYALYPHLTVAENLGFPLKVRRVPKGEIRQRIAETAALLELGGCLDRLPRELSGGQRQRVALGRAIVRRPRLFLLDEPLSNLDAQLRGQMRLEICHLQRRLATTMIYVTHDQAEAMAVGDRIAVMGAGQIHQVADPLNLYDCPVNTFVAGFIGSPPMNFIRGALQSESGGVWFRAERVAASSSSHPLQFGVPRAQAASCRAYIGRPIILGLRPEAIDCSQNGKAEGAECLVQATLERVEPLGGETHLHLSVGGVGVVARANAAGWAAGNRIAVKFQTAKGHFFDPATGQRIR